MPESEYELVISVGETKWASNWHEFESYAASVRAAGQIFLERMFGERCEEYDPDCPCCKKWRQLDQLTKNPFEEPPHA